MERSRLSRRLEKQSKKKLMLNIVGILFVLFLLIKFGIPLLINFSLFLVGSKSQEAEKKTNMFVQPPVLASMPNATKSAEIVVSGSAGKNQQIHLYVNDELVDKMQTDEDGSFVFEDIPITPGENTIKARAVLPNKDKTDFSNVLVVVYKDKAPTLELENPKDGQTFGKDDGTVQVNGKTDSGEVRVTINGFRAIVEESGDFSYSLRLKPGENKILIIATDEAENKTEKEIKVTYSQ